ncbi:MAG: hypothetical protein AMK74_06360, partial [Nitrospira bacterium SM23_35]
GGASSEREEEGSFFSRSLKTMIAIAATMTASEKYSAAKKETLRIADPDRRQAYFIGTSRRYMAQNSESATNETARRRKKKNIGGRYMM